MTTGLAQSALKKAPRFRKPLPGRIHLSDRGSQYCAAGYHKDVENTGMIASMSRKGNYYESAPTNGWQRACWAGPQRLGDVGEDPLAGSRAHPRGRHEGSVPYRSQYNPYFRTDSRLFPATEFLVEVLQHLPEPGNRLIRRYVARYISAAMDCILPGAPALVWPTGR